MQRNPAHLPDEDCSSLPKESFRHGAQHGRGNISRNAAAAGPAARNSKLRLATSCVCMRRKPIPGSPSVAACGPVCRPNCRRRPRKASGVSAFLASHLPVSWLALA